MDELLLLLLTMTALSSFVYSCPLSCSCDVYLKKTTCQGVNSLETIAKDVPISTATLIIDQSSFTSVRQSDFAKLPSKQISSLAITRGSLDEIFDSAFAEIAFSLLSLDLKENRIRAIGGRAFNGLQNLQELDLSRNILTYFPQDIFKPLSALKVLNLGYNKFSNNFPNNLFSAQSNLQTLTLDGNSLVSLKASMFQGLKNLQVLNVHNCAIKTMNNDVFLHITMLTNLDLSFNQLYSLPPAESLSNLRNLRNLTLLGNTLSVVGQDQFNGLSIDTLDLTRNKINQLHPDAFRGMVKVRYLLLSENNLVSLPEKIFKPIGAELYSLKLSGNRGLYALPDKVFDDLQQIRELNMSYCGLKRLQDQQFVQVFTLQQVDLSYNRLEYLPSSLLDRANFMTQLKLEGNPWNCDCLIKPFRNWLKDPRSAAIMGCQYSSMSYYNGNGCRKPTCSTPTRHMYQDISILTDNDLSDSCEKIGASRSSVQLEVIIGIVAAIILIILLIVLCACCLYRRHKRGEPLLCTDTTEHVVTKEAKPKKRKEFKRNEYFEEKKEKRRIDADSSSLNESDKSFIVRNYFHSMVPDPDTESQGTIQSMARKDSIESLSQYEYGSRHGSRHSSQYSLNTAYRIESAV